MKDAHDATPTSKESPRNRVLFIDDSRLMRFTARKSLSNHYDVVLADGGAAAIEQLEYDPAITVIVTDLMMPGTDGFDVIRYVRSARDARIRALPIMAVTGSTVEGDRLRALELGADDLMTKPFRPAVLQQRIARLLAEAEAAHPAGDSTGDSTDDPPSASVPVRLDVLAAPNVERSRVGFAERLRQALALHQRHGLPLALLHLRLTNSGEIEAVMGAAMLNAVMRQVEADLVGAVRAEDTVGRTGRDHFTVLLPATPMEGARILRRRVLDAVGIDARSIRGRSVRLKVSALIHRPHADLDARSLLGPSDPESAPGPDGADGRQVVPLRRFRGGATGA